MTNHGTTADYGTMADHGTMTSGTMTSSAPLPSGTPATSAATSGGLSSKDLPSGGSTARQLILYASAAVGLWVLASFAGTMLDPAHASLWTGSLMWSLLASLLISPALLVARPLTSGAFGRGAEAGARTGTRAGARPMGVPSVAPSEAAASGAAASGAAASKTGASEAGASETTPFVGKGARLWPEPAELREKADLRRKAAAFEQAAFDNADGQTAFENAADLDGQDGSLRAETVRTPITA